MESHVADVGDHEKGLVSSTPGHTSLADALPTTSSSASTAPVLVPSNLWKEIDPEKKYVKRVTGRHGNTELHFAAQRGDLAAVKQILDDIDFQMMECSSGADFDPEVAEIRTSVVNEVNELGETALFIAADRGHIEVVRELLKHSNHETLTKRTLSMFDPLYIAASQGHHEIVKVLLEFDPTLSTMVGPSNLNPLITAASRGHISVVKELLSTDWTLLQIICSNGKTALHFAARQGHMEIVETLLRIEPLLARMTDRKGQTALHMAVKGVNCEVVKLLLCVDPATVMLPDKFGNTALHVATRKKRVEMVNTLLSLPDINVNALNQSGKTALDIVEELPLSEESSTIKDCLCLYDAMRANEMNLPSSEWRKTATQIKKDKKGVDTPPKLLRTVTQIKKDAHTQLRLLALFWADILVAYSLFVMQNYLTQVWGLSFTHAAGILNVWNGIAMILPVFYAIIRDEMLGNFQMLAISSISYIVGIGFVAMSTPPVLAKYTGMCKQYHPECIGRTQKTLFYIGMALIAEGMAGKAVSLHPFPNEHQGKHEKDLENPSLHPLQPEQQGKNKKNVEIRIGSLRRRGRTIGLILAVVGAMALPYIRPWSMRFGIPAICTATATFLFWSGWPWYDKGIPGRSPVCNICRAFVAKQIYRGEDKVNKSSTDTPYILRSVEKADIKLEDRSPKDETKNKWTLCSVAEVEEAKSIVQMLPIMLTFIVCGMVSSIGNTYFVEQASHLNRHIGKWSVPLPALLLFQDIFRNYFRILRARGEDVALRVMHNRFLPVMIGSAMVYSILCCITAAKIEERRLNAIRKHNLMDRPDEDIPMSMYWLIFQFYLLVMFDICFEWGVAAFYNNQVTGTLKTYVMLLSRALLGVGYMLNVVLVYVVGKISERGGNIPNWFQFTSNKSRLDRYFWVLAALSSVNLVIFILVASCYRNNKKKTTEPEAGAGVEEAYQWAN